MPNSQIKSLTVDGVTYDIVDRTSGYVPEFVVTITGNDNVGYSADKTFSEIIAAYLNGNNIICEKGGTRISLLEIDDSSGAMFELSAMTVNGRPAAEIVTITTTNVVNHQWLYFTETDPVFTDSAAYGISSSDITNWNSKTSNTGTITSVQTTAGAHTAINVSSGAASFNVPTKTSHLTNDSGFLTSFDIASVMSYKGTKANYAALPSSGNTTGDVWHLTDTGAEWAWDGSAWQELGTAIDTSSFLTTETDPVFSASAAAGITSTDISNWNGKTSNTGTVTSVTVSNATNGGLSVSGSPISTSGTITVGHSNVLSSAQTIQAIYPIKIDKNGHISEYGSAVTIPSVYNSSTNPNGYLTMATLPIYNGMVE